MVANLVLGREPLYALGQWAAGYDPGLLGLSGHEVGLVNDDRVGRALQALFDADRASLLTAVVLRAIAEFDVEVDKLQARRLSDVHAAVLRRDGPPLRLPESRLRRPVETRPRH